MFFFLYVWTYLHNIKDTYEKENFKNGYNIVKKIHKIERQKKSVTQNFKHILQAKITFKKIYLQKKDGKFAQCLAFLNSVYVHAISFIDEKAKFQLLHTSNSNLILNM